MLQFRHQHQHPVHPLYLVKVIAKGNMAIIIAFILAKLSHIFPNTFYVTLLESYPDGRPKKWRWSPIWVDNFLKATYERPKHKGS